MPDPKSHRRSACAPELLADYAPQRCLQRLPCLLNVPPQGLIDQSLVAAPSRSMNLLAKPRQDVIVQTNRDPRLASRDRNHRTTPGLGEIVFLLHVCPSYCWRSLGVAGRAEISRIVSPRQVYTTTNTRPRVSIPTLIHRRSSSDDGSSIVRARSSSKTPTASAKSTPCFWRLRRAFAESH